MRFTTRESLPSRSAGLAAPTRPRTTAVRRGRAAALLAPERPREPPRAGDESCLSPGASSSHALPVPRENGFSASGRPMLGRDVGPDWAVGLRSGRAGMRAHRSPSREGARNAAPLVSRFPPESPVPGSPVVPNPHGRLATRERERLGGLPPEPGRGARGEGVVSRRSAPSRRGRAHRPGSSAAIRASRVRRRGTAAPEPPMTGAHGLGNHVVTPFASLAPLVGDAKPAQPRVLQRVSPAEGARTRRRDRSGYGPRPSAKEVGPITSAGRPAGGGRGGPRRALIGRTSRGQSGGA